MSKILEALKRAETERLQPLLEDVIARPIRVPRD